MDRHFLMRLVPAVRIRDQMWTGQRHQGHFEVSRQIPYHVIDSAQEHEVHLGFYDTADKRFFHLHEVGIGSSEHLNHMQRTAQAAHEMIQAGVPPKQALTETLVRRVLNGESLGEILEGAWPSLKSQTNSLKGKRLRPGVRSKSRSTGFSGEKKAAPTPTADNDTKKKGVRYRDNLHHVWDGAGRTEFRVYGKRDQDDVKKKLKSFQRRREVMQS
jgi:hypothetical protein